MKLVLFLTSYELNQVNYEVRRGKCLLTQICHQTVCTIFLYDLGNCISYQQKIQMLTSLQNVNITQWMGPFALAETVFLVWILDTEYYWMFEIETGSHSFHNYVLVWTFLFKNEFLEVRLFFFFLFWSVFHQMKHCIQCNRVTVFSGSIMRR